MGGEGRGGEGRGGEGRALTYPRFLVYATRVCTAGCVSCTQATEWGPIVAFQF